MSSVRGAGETRRNLKNRLTTMADSQTYGAIYAVLYDIGTNASLDVPVDSSNLINSRTRPLIRKGRSGWIGRIGFTAEYAAAVHDAKGVLLGDDVLRDPADPSRGYVWDPDGKPGYLVDNFNDYIPHVVDAFKDSYGNR